MESQPTVTEFPTHAWSSSASNTVYQPDPPPPSPTSQLQSDVNSTIAASRSFVNNDTFSETASDSGAPRSILKRRECRSATLPRSYSTPSIRDSLEVTKRHFKSSKADTPPQV